MVQNDGTSTAVPQCITKSVIERYIGRRGPTKEYVIKNIFKDTDKDNDLDL